MSDFQDLVRSFSDGLRSPSAEAWAASGTWATAVVAMAAAWFALVQVREARGLREAQAQPFVIVALEQSPIESYMIQLRVENVGQTLARDVTFIFDPPLASALARKNADYDLADSALVKGGVPFMPPGMSIVRLLDDAREWGENFEKVPNAAYALTVNFADHRGRPQEPLTYRIDLAAFRDGYYFHQYSVHHLADPLREIRDYMKSWSEGAAGTKGLAVVTRDGDTKDERIRERIAEQRRARLGQQESDGERSTVKDIYLRFLRGR